MRGLILAALLVAACGDLQPDSRALAPARASPSSVATPLPSGVIDPQPLIERDKTISAVVLRADTVAAKLTTMQAAMAGSATGPSIDGSPVWAIAIVGQLRPAFGPIDTGTSPCGVFFHDASTGDVRGVQMGALATCQPYFKDSLAPADAPLHCSIDHFPPGVFEHFQFNATRPGPQPLYVARDDAWRTPATVAGAFLLGSPEGGDTYLRAYCITAFVHQVTASDPVLGGMGAVKPDRPLRTNEFAIWLRSYHAISMAADDAGHVTVTIEPRPGFEWAFFDWKALVGTSGYVQFRLVDRSGAEIVPWIVGNGGSPTKLGTTAALPASG